ncbi:MAG: STAS domain-containing protein [SAR324 cluster bacterium]|nr:STAS domain-containing protein [SAR324 cluster bacterium]
MLEFISEDNQTGKLRIQGHSTIGYAKELKTGLVEALDKVQLLKLDLSGLTEADLSFVQLLYSLSQTAAKSGKTVQLDGLCPALLRQLVDTVGFNQKKWLCFG